MTLSKNTKVRIVYDSSAKSSKGVSCLKDCLYQGPITLPDLCMWGVTKALNLPYCYVEKAFLQIGIQQKQRNMTHFFIVS